MSDAANISFEPVDNTRLANLCGAFDENLRQIATALERFYLEAGHDISLERLQLGLIEAMKHDLPDKQSESVPLLMTRKAEVRGRTVRQNEYLQAIQEHDITFGVGPAGTGKTYLAVASAVDALQRETVKRLVRPRHCILMSTHTRTNSVPNFKNSFPRLQYRKMSIW